MCREREPLDTRIIGWYSSKQGVQHQSSNHWTFVRYGSFTKIHLVWSLTHSDRMLLTRSSATFFYDIELFQYAGTGDLATLCRVSRMFQHGAEHILYHNVKLQNITDGDRLISWCHAIVGMERRAHRVHTLHLPTRFELSQPLATSASAEAIGKMIKLAFKAMINLRQLCCSTVVSGSARLASLHPSTLEDCEFHLSAFAGELPSFMPSDVWKFLARHPGITYWAPGHPLLCSIPSFPSSILPNLNEVVFTRPALTLCLKGRPIQTLVLVFTDLVHRRWDGLEAIAPLESFNDTLHHLVYLQGGNMCVDWTAVDIVCSISQKVPKLRSLHLDCRVAEVRLGNFFTVHMVADYDFPDTHRGSTAFR